MSNFTKGFLIFIGVLVVIGLVATGFIVGITQLISSDRGRGALADYTDKPGTRNPRGAIYEPDAHSHP